MKNPVKIVSLMLVLTLFASLALIGCGANNAGDTATTAAVQASSGASTAAAASTTAPALDKVTLVTYLLGAAPTDGPAVMAEVNKKLENDINATIDLRYIDFADMQTKPALLLAAGEDIDFIYANKDTNYATLAAKGSYSEITREDVQKYMPLTAKLLTDAQWADAMVDGKVYMIPQLFKELNTGAIFYREDLREKYNVPEIKTVTDLEAYFKAIKTNEKAMVPVDGTSDDVVSLFSSYLLNIGNYDGTIGPGGIVGAYSSDDPTYTIAGIFDDKYLTAFKQAATWMKQLYDEGLLPKNPFGNKTSMNDLFKAGKIATKGNAFENYPQSVTEASAGWEIGCLPVVLPSGNTTARPSTGNGLSIAASSKQLQRCLMAIDFLTQDKEYDWLLSFGIKDKDYIIKDDGALDLAPGIDPAQNPYPMYGAGWWMCNRDLWPAMASQPKVYLDLKSQVVAKAQSYLLSGFNANYDSVKTENANVTNVYQQYAIPIELGMVKDVDAAIKELQEKLKAAGYDKVHDSIKQQVADFVKSHTN